MIVVGLSGAQGAGKSTLLIELMKRGWRLDEFRVSRHVQKQLGWDSLDQVMDDPETMFTYQQMVLDQKYKHDAEFVWVDPRIEDNTELLLTERTFADILAYTNQWTWRFVDQGKLTLEEAIEFLKPYGDLCKKYHNEIYTATLLLPFMPHMPWDNDPNRAEKKDTKAVFEDIERFLQRKTPVTHKRLYITAESVEDRATQVEAFLRTL